MKLFNPGRNSLQMQIDSTAQRLKKRREDLQHQRADISQQLNRQLATPHSLLLAGGTGFLLGELQQLRQPSAPEATEASLAQTLAWAPNVGPMLKLAQEALALAHDAFITLAESMASEQTDTATPATEPPASEKQPSYRAGL